MKHYAVEFNDNHILIFEAEDVEDLCFKISMYYGFCTTLFGICMRGCNTIEENILVTNEYLKNKDNDKIKCVYLIECIEWKDN